jgi:thioredoxin-dependent peroxiredoxin
MHSCRPGEGRTRPDSVVAEPADSVDRMEVGDRVEDFALVDQRGQTVRLSSLLASGPVVLFFYPAALTTGCTAESCHFRDLRAEFGACGASVVGISMDSVDRQAAFADRHGLDFPLLSDTTGEIAARFGVRRRLLPMLRVRRMTFVIGEDATVVGVVRSEIAMDKHADGALRLLRSRQRAS